MVDHLERGSVVAKAGLGSELPVFPHAGGFGELSAHISDGVGVGERLSTKKILEQLSFPAIVLSFSYSRLGSRSCLSWSRGTPR